MKTFIFGVSIFISLVLLFGLPDTLFGKGNILYYLYDNVHETPSASLGFMLQLHPLVYLFTRQFPLIYGYVLYIAAILALIYWIFLFLRTGLHKSLDIYKYQLLIVVSVLFFIGSILPLQIFAGGNRSLVLLPFMVLLVAVTVKKISKKRWNNFIITITILLGFVQLYQCFSWVYMRSTFSPQELSSVWIQDNIKPGERIGIENIPIYQQLPDIIQQEFYFQQYNVTFMPQYTYEIIDAKTKSLPSVIIITNENMDKKLLRISPKNELVKRIHGEKYTALKSFTPDFRYYKTFGDDMDFYLANILTMPVTTTIYKKDIPK